MCSLKTLLLCAGGVFLCLFETVAQPAWRINVPVSLQVGASLAKAEADSGAQWTQGIGALLQLRAGLGLRYKDVAGIDAEGGLFLNSTIFRQGSNEYSLSQYDPQIAAQFYILQPCPAGAGCDMRLAFGYGMSFISADVEVKDEEFFYARTDAPKARIPFIAPEIGLTNTADNVYFDLSIRYTFHTQSVLMYETALYSDAGSTRFSSRGNSLGLVLRVRPVLNPKAKAPKPLPAFNQVSPEKMKDYDGRKTEKSGSFSFRRKKVTLLIRDNADIDGDSLSIAFNGQLILEEYMLTKEFKKLKITLDSGLNTLMVYAINEGSVSPNTAECIIKSGWKKHKLMLTSSFKRNEAIELILED